MKIAISGFGLATSLGCDLNSFWEAIKLGNENEVKNVDHTFLSHALSQRHLNKLDNFTIFAIHAARQCLESANLQIDDTNANRIGIMLGNNFGGWSYVESQLKTLYQGDMDSINPYVATAWFPTAPQGEISILFGIKGISKTFSSDKISSGYALEAGFQALLMDDLDYVIVGGTEAPFSELIKSYIGSKTLLSFGEGAAVLLLEKDLSRTQDTFATLEAVSIEADLDASIYKSLSTSHLSPSDIDCVILNATGQREQNFYERQCLESIFPPETNLASMTHLFGNIIGASSAIDVIVGCLMIQDQCIPPFPNKLLLDYKGTPFSLYNKTRQYDLKNVLIVGMDESYQSCSIVIQKP